MVNNMNDQQKNYFHLVKASGRAFGFLGLLLGVTGGVLTGVAVKGLIGEPVVSGGGAAAFYIAFGISSLLTLYVMFNYVTMSLRVDSGENGVFDVRLGMKSASVNIADITAVRVAEPKSRMTRVASQAKSGSRTKLQIWSVLGVGTGIELDIAKSDDGAPAMWFVSSNDPEALSEKLNSLITSPDDEPAETADIEPEA
ncbi:MAG TPA: DUF3093 family protein [Dehalococcoidia bacterium]|jgi:formate-dependent nitrite reductase membrane component NrfD|nr:DUF3093 family protein [Dehalococcoidia bacterium]HIK88371.1 DUF3093 family protein [Dehalococcoidia bacterium]